MSAGFGLRDIRWVFERLAIRQRPELPDSSLVMIGGQALNYWCDLYRSDCAELDQYGPFSSKDLDFQAARDLIPWCSEQLGGKYTLARPGPNTLLNGMVKAPNPNGGDELSIDFLQRPYGLAAADTVRFSATVDVHTPMATIGIQVMHPLHCLVSRVHNVMDLPDDYDNEHGLRQLKAAIVCLRRFIEANAVLESKRAYILNERVFKFAVHDLPANRLFKSKSIDVFDAASNAETLSEEFRGIRYPKMLEELAKRRR